jgi:Transposase DDE domain
MAKRKDVEISEADLHGFHYFKVLRPLLDRLHADGTTRDRAGNRELFYDGYATLLLLYFFSPALTSLRSLEQASGLAKVQKRLGVGRTSLSSMSEAAHIFNPALLRELVSDLARVTRHRLPRSDAKKLANLIAVDGTLLPALPRMAWAVWQSPQQRAAKAHVAFEVLSAIPVDATITAGSGPERPQWRAMARPGGFYVVDRGYADYSLFRELDALPCRFIGRLQENAVYEMIEERELTAEARRAGVVRDATIRRLGTEKHNAFLDRSMRIIIVERPGPRPGGPAQQWVLVTNDLGLAADLVALGYRYRWAIELFFRWLKCILQCRHLLSECQSGVEMQIYVALIATLLIVSRTGLHPTKRTYEMICHYVSGWASLKELEAHIAARKIKEAPS